MTDSQADFYYRSEERHPVVDAFVAELFGDPGALRADIAFGDEMFAYALTESQDRRGQALYSYLRSGLEIDRLLRQVVEWRFGGWPELESLLDFAGGYGRSTRYLARDLQPEQIWVADISQAGVEFQGRQFGVNGLFSSRRAEDFSPGRRFGAVFCFSFFTHTPRPAFEGWLRKLWSLIESGGVMVFTTSGPEMVLPGRGLDAEGFYYERVSEIEALDVEEYGSTWVSEGFVRAAVERCCPEASTVHFFRRRLWSYQDVYVVTKGGPPFSLVDRPSSGQLELPRSPVGYLEICRPVEWNRLRLYGWAIDPEQQDVERALPVTIQVKLGGELVAECRAELERDDLKRAHGEAHARAGWDCGVESERGFDPSGVLLVKAITDDGRNSILHVSLLDGADLVARVNHAEHVAAERYRYLEAKIAAMQASRFWRLRNRWFRIKQRLGWIEEIWP